MYRWLSIMEIMMGNSSTRKLTRHHECFTLMFYMMVKIIKVILKVSGIYVNRTFIVLLWFFCSLLWFFTMNWDLCDITFVVIPQCLNIRNKKISKSNITELWDIEWCALLVTVELSLFQYPHYKLAQPVNAIIYNQCFVH